ncbi:hypothetical protein D9757_004707 [Collybiopsis confluens]|uniref:RlpA-like protein double-psi beta-barrel domain-containing protein n=1 Tax=Collybiopsis confluens TaxID=2823264 RepID=A0A8H5HSA5_9AGAR|nr:hypothetical protein D9757_004707 [Collybiopsis confluens]
MYPDLQLSSIPPCTPVVLKISQLFKGDPYRSPMISSISLPVLLSVTAFTSARAVFPRATDYTGGTGQGTFYDTGLTSCGETHTDSDLIVALSHLFYDSYPGATANPNKYVSLLLLVPISDIHPISNPVCGKKLTAHYQGKSVQVAVADRCTGCDMYDLDFTPSAFQKLGQLEVGRISGVTWRFETVGVNSTDSKAEKKARPITQSLSSGTNDSENAAENDSAKTNKPTSTSVSEAFVSPTASLKKSIDTNSPTIGSNNTDTSSAGDETEDDSDSSDLGNSTTTVTGLGTTLNSVTIASDPSTAVGSGSVTHLTGDGAVINTTTNSNGPDGSNSVTTSFTTSTHLNSTTTSGKHKQRSVWGRELN